MSCANVEIGDFLLRMPPTSAIVFFSLKLSPYHRSQKSKIGARFQFILRPRFHFPPTGMSALDRSV